MKATGIIRRIDDLGRLVVPREIRHTLGINDGDPLEIYIDDNAVCFKKYRHTLSAARLKEILQNAIMAYEFELEQQDYADAEDVHGVVLNELEITEEEYMEVMERRYEW